MSAAFAPRLSVVATARNDDHGGNLLGRMQLFVDGILDQARRFTTPIELILVEWNPPHDRPPLVEALDFHTHGSSLTDVRVITVPPHVHRRFEHADRLPLFQMIAKNVGVRRSRAGRVLVTNVDILLSDALFERALQAPLDRTVRADRLDVTADVPVAQSPRERLKWCRTNVIREHRFDVSIDRRDGKHYRIYWEPTPRVRLLEALQDWRLVPTVTRKRLHVNGCGDFTLVPRAAFDAVGGYAEFAAYSMHIDALFCTSAHFAGFRELCVESPAVAYHIEHTIGSGWSPEGQGVLNARLAQAGVPQLSVDDLHRMSVTMRKQNGPTLFNAGPWGLPDDDPPEVRPLSDRIARAHEPVHGAAA